MLDRDIAFAPATAHLKMIATKQVSPVELVELYLQRIQDLGGKLNAYLTVTADEAIKAARDAESAVMRGDTLGPLHGLPISIKDLEMTNGVRTTGGSLVYKDRVPTEDSVVVERVLKAGAIMLGKTNTPEFGLLGESRNLLGDHCRNPWNTDRTTGGSSGGAGGSVVAGLSSLATGSDGGGSIRIPCSYCGIYGIKPTQGRVPRYGGASAVVLANQFSQSGPMTRTVRDSAVLLQVLAGHDPRDASSIREAPPDFVAALDRGIKGLRIAWSPDYGHGVVDPEVAEIVGGAARVFEELGCTVEETSLSMDSPFDPFWDLFCANAYASYGSLLDNDADKLTDYGRTCIERGVSITGAEYARALGQIDRLKAQVAALLDEYDLLMSPTTAVTAYPVGKPPHEIGGKAVDPFAGAFPFTYPINMIGHAAAAVPCGFSADGLPVSLHVVGRMRDEETVLAASAAFEEARPWIQTRPPVS